MASEKELREKLRRIEALFAGTTFAGERLAAGAAADVIRRQLDALAGREAEIEMRFSISDPWARRLLVALCRRYGVRAYRYPRMQRQSLIVKAPRSFLDRILWPEFQELNKALTEYLSEVTERVIREEVFGETGEAEEVKEPPQIKSR